MVHLVFDLSKQLDQLDLNVIIFPAEIFSKTIYYNEVCHYTYRCGCIVPLCAVDAKIQFQFVGRKSIKGSLINYFRKIPAVLTQSILITLLNVGTPCPSYKGVCLLERTNCEESTNELQVSLERVDCIVGYRKREMLQ